MVAEGEKVDSAYGERARLMKEKTTLETAVQLKEAEAIMQIQGEGRSQYVIWKGEKIALTNDTLRILTADLPQKASTGNWLM
ncbi:hypothetical protein QNN00_14255 [Bacillus velezensis]|nr:hypothetical protein [Bacillus velezensis]